MNSVIPGRWRRMLPWAIILIAFVLRVGYAARGGIDRPLPAGGDELEYDTYAWNLAQGNGYRGMSPDVADQNHLTAYRSPGPSLVFAGIYLVTGHSLAAIRLFNCALSALTCLLIIGLGRRCFNETTGLAAAAVWAFWPVSIFMSGQVLSEPLALMGLLGLVIAALKFADRPIATNALLAGLLLGFNMLVHPSRLFLLPFVGLWALVQFRRSPRALALTAIVPFVALLMLAPWVVRNQRVFGRFIPFSTMGGSVLLQGNNRIVATDPEYLGYNVWDTELPEYRDALRAPNDEFVRDSVAKVFAVTFIKEHKDRWLPMFFAKLRRGWTPLLQPRTPLPQRLGMLFSWGPILLIGLTGFFPWLLKWLRTGNPSWLLHLVILHMAALNVVFFGLARYRYVVEPFCVLIAMGSVVWVVQKRSQRLPKSAQGAAALTDVSA